MPDDIAVVKKAWREKLKRLEKGRFFYRTQPVEHPFDKQMDLINSHDKLEAERDQLRERVRELEGALLAVEVLIREHRLRCPLTWLEKINPEKEASHE